MYVYQYRILMNNVHRFLALVVMIQVLSLEELKSLGRIGRFINVNISSEHQ
jgi:hypothetical protein